MNNQTPSAPSSVPRRPAPSASGSALSVVGLRKAFGPQIVLDDINLDVSVGTVFSLLGPNGAAIGVTGQFSAVDNLLTADENLILMADLHHLGRELRWLSPL